MMLAVQYIIGQLNSPVEQLMNFFYSLQDVKISLERINEIHQMDDENGKEGLLTSIEDKNEGIGEATNPAGQGLWRVRRDFVLRCSREAILSWDGGILLLLLFFSGFSGVLDV